MFKKEYFITYNKIVHKKLGRIVEPKTTFSRGWSAEDAWAKVTQKESEFNGLEIINIQRV